MDKNKVQNWYQSFCKKHCLDPQKFDIESEIDMGISATENINILESKLKVLLKPVSQLTKAEIDTINELERQRIKDEASKVLQGFKKVKSRIHGTERTRMIEHFIKMVVKRSASSLIVLGRTGIGKTYKTLSVLNELKVDYEYLNGFTTPLALYKSMYANREKLMVLDDLEGLFCNSTAVSLLKSALGEVSGKRIVHYTTTSKAAMGTPPRFEMKGGVIILCNEINGSRNSENFRALLSRAMTLEYEMTQKEIIELCNELMHEKDLTDEQQSRVLQIINDNRIDMPTFNLRDFERLIEIVKYDSEHAEEMFVTLMQLDEEDNLILRLMRSDLPVAEQVAKYEEEMGKDRATYYRRKKRLTKLIGKSKGGE